MSGGHPTSRLQLMKWAPNQAYFKLEMGELQGYFSMILAAAELYLELDILSPAALCCTQ